MTADTPTPAEADPKGLIRESFRIEGITPAECRSIFVDWALALPAAIPPERAIRVLLDHHAARLPAGGGVHPMIEVLRAGVAPPGEPGQEPGQEPGWRRRQGGAMGRRDRAAGRCV